MTDLMGDIMGHIIDMKGSLSSLETKVDRFSEDLSEMKVSISKEHKDIHDRIDNADKKAQLYHDDRKKLIWTTGGVSLGGGLVGVGVGKFLHALVTIFTGQ